MTPYLSSLSSLIIYLKNKGLLGCLKGGCEGWEGRGFSATAGFYGDKQPFVFHPDGSVRILL